jgi:hypothetical protein
MENVTFQPLSICAFGSQPRAFGPGSDVWDTWMTIPPGTPSNVSPFGRLRDARELLRKNDRVLRLSRDTEM